MFLLDISCRKEVRKRGKSIPYHQTCLRGRIHIQYLSYMTNTEIENKSKALDLHVKLFQNLTLKFIVCFVQNLRSSDFDNSQ